MLWQLAIFLISSFQGSPLNRAQQELPHYPVITDYGPQTLREQEQAFEALYSENDMIFPADFSLSAGIKDTKYRWPGYPNKGIVPYVIDESLATQKNLILKAMSQFNKLTCVNFVERKEEKDYIKLQNGTGCNSLLGRHGGEQIINLGEGCYYIGSIVHELGHAIGFYHEHQRSDRDNYLWIYEKNITAGREHNFKKIRESQEVKETAFNTNSIMIYGNYAFSKQPGALMTMQAKNGRPLREPFVKPGLDNDDVDQVRILYKCK